jgi:hypothetical protein
MSTALSVQQMNLPVWVGVHSGLSLGHFAWLTPWQLRVKCFAWSAKDDNQRSRHTFSEERVDAPLKPVGLLCAAFFNPLGRYRPRWQPTRPKTNSCTGSGDKGPSEECSQFLELIGAIVAAAPADYTRNR